MSTIPLVLVLAGGVGGGKLARGMAGVLPPEKLTVIVNTADDFVHLGLHISPDLDSVLYALADVNDLERGWGLAGETWNFMGALGRLGGDTWFQLGDCDLATHVQRTLLLREGNSLSEVTAVLARGLGIKAKLFPMSDQRVRSIIDTDDGTLDFQDYFVRRRCEPRFRGARFDGTTTASPSAGFSYAIKHADIIVIAPSNPFVSIEPILSLMDVRQELRTSPAPIVAVSPIVGGNAVKGPLAKMMRELGIEASVTEIARHYQGLADGWIIDEVDSKLADEITALGFRVGVTNSVMRSIEDKIRVAKAAVDLGLASAQIRKS
jgi:LPPG:FO 2-phospho-L-lactate transferase